MRHYTLIRLGKIWTLTILLLPSLSWSQHLPPFVHFSENYMLINPAIPHHSFLLGTLNPDYGSAYRHNGGVLYKTHGSQSLSDQSNFLALKYSYVYEMNGGDPFHPTTFLTFGTAFLQDKDGPYFSRTGLARLAYRRGNGHFFLSGGLSASYNWQEYDPKIALLLKRPGSSGGTDPIEKNNFFGLQIGALGEWLTNSSHVYAGVSWHPTALLMPLFPEGEQSLEFDPTFHCNIGYLQQIVDYAMETLLWLRMTENQDINGNANVRYGFPLAAEGSAFGWVGVGGNFAYSDRLSVKDVFFEPSFLFHTYGTLQFRIGIAIGVYTDANISSSGNPMEYYGSFSFGDLEAVND